MTSAKRPFLVAISGGSGSCKTMVATALAAALAPRSAYVLSEDDYYRDFGREPGFDPDATNFDHIDARDHAALLRDLDALVRGETVEHPLYDFTCHARKAETRLLPAADVLIVEGLHLLHPEALRRRFDLTVYLHVPDDIRLGRRLLRDIKERARDPDEVVGRYFATVRPMHYAFTEPGRDVADLVIDAHPGHKPAETEQTVATILAEVDKRAARPRPTSA